MRPSPSRLVRFLYRVTVVGFWFSIVGGVMAVVAMLALKDFYLSTVVHGVALPTGLRAPNGNLRVEAHIVRPDMAARVLLALFFVVAIGLFAYGIVQVRRVLGSVRSGDPFVIDNVHRLRTLGGLFLAAPAVDSVLMAIATSAALPDNVHNATVHFGIPMAAWIGAALLFVLAEVFAHGVRLREEVEGTV